MMYHVQGIRLLLIVVLIAKFEVFEQSARAQSQPQLGHAPVPAAIPTPQSVRPSQKITLQEFLQRVAIHHPGHDLDILDLKRSEVEIEKVGLFADPTVSLARERTPFGLAFQSREVRERMNDTNNDAMWTLTATQTFPWPGSLDAAKQAAQKTVEVAAIRIDAAHALHIFEAQEVFLNLLTLSRLVVIEQENLREADRILKSARARLSFGVGNQFETLSAQSEKSLLASNIDNLAAELSNLELFAKQLMGVPLDQKVEFDFGTQKAELAHDLQSHELLSAGGSEAGDFKIRPLKLAVAAENKMLESERARSMPEFMGSVMLMRDDTGMKMYGAMVSMRVPLFSGSMRSALSHEESLVAQKAKKEIAWHVEKKALALAQVHSRSEVLKKNFETLQNDLIPLATQRLSAGLTEYSQGRGNLGNVNEARKALLRFKSAQVNLERDLAIADVAKKRIAAGFEDGEINVPIPALPSSNMSDGAMATPGMPAQLDSSSQKKMATEALRNKDSAGSRPILKPRQISPESGELNPAPDGASNGMGM